jgi:ABC-2 type transport system permease protein
MKKMLLIGFKDLTLMFRDRAALTFMLLAPFLLTLGMGFVTGRFSGGSNGLSDIPVVLVNLDGEQLGNALVDTFNSADLADLVEPAASADPAAARALIDEDKAAAAIIIPAGFTRSVIPAQSDLNNPAALRSEVVQIEVYANPARPTSAGVVKSIVDEFIARVEEGRTGGMTTGIQLVTSGLVDPQNASAEITDLMSGLDQPENSAITLRTRSEGAAPVEFDMLAYFAPGMALMFLMYTVTAGGRSILAERAHGTLPRLLVSPTHSAQVLGGKILGIVFTGVAQVSVLILASTLFFQVKWGNPLGIVVLILAAVFGASGWGMLITALARTPAQVSNTGSALMLIFGILGGGFINLDQMHPAMRLVSKITPNAWGLDGFTALARGGSLASLVEPVGALLLMGAVLFAVAVALFNRGGLVQK